MRSWPEDGEPAHFEDLVAPLEAAVLQMNGTRPSAAWQEPDSYDGYNVGDQHINLSVVEQLSAENLIRQEVDQGRSPLNVVLSIAVQIGIEQGRRIAQKSLSADVLHTLTKLREDLADAD